MIIEMRKRVQNAIDSKRKIVWLDETMFTKTTNLKKEWSKRLTNFTIPCEAKGSKFTAVLAAISFGYGFEHVELYDTAVDEVIFLKYLRRLKEINENENLTIVMDNLAVHKTDDVKSLMRELGFEWIYNVPYSPEYNAIELPFGQIKKHFREAKLVCLANEFRFD